jgi:hypothetical protein
MFLQEEKVLFPFILVGLSRFNWRYLYFFEGSGLKKAPVKPRLVQLTIRKSLMEVSLYLTSRGWMLKLDKPKS